MGRATAPLDARAPTGYSAAEYRKVHEGVWMRGTLLWSIVLATFILVGAALLWSVAVAQTTW